jgi:transposase
MVATKPVDFRKGMDGLAALVKEQLRADPFSGVVYVFRAKRAERSRRMSRRRFSSAPLSVFDRLHFGSRRFEESIDALTRDSIHESLGQIEATLRERYSVASQPAGPAKASTKTRKA